MKQFKLPKWSIFLLAGTIMTSAAFVSCKKESLNPELTSNAKPSAPKTKLDKPTIAGGVSTTASIEIVVTAGATGAPAGFSIQWITAAAYAAGPDGISGNSDDNSWPSSDAAGLCKASFSGNASGYFYNLGPGAAVTVKIGDILYDNPGASTNCADALTCGIQYVFRSFAHATSTFMRSDFTGNLSCSTADCPTDGCSFSQGYWFNNASVHPWPGSITFGSCTYDEAGGRALKVLYKAGGAVMQSFLQASAIKLSFYSNPGDIPAAVAADVSIIETILGNYPCLSTTTALPVFSATDAAAATAAAARISTWIDDHHCP